MANGEHDTFNQDEDPTSMMRDYLARARAASDSGDFLLSMYLYLAAFEQASRGGEVPSEDALLGLKEAWALAYAHKERSLAEYIFERMEPYLTTDEVRLCSEQLQDLVFDKLEEFGLSRQELEDMAQMISEDLQLPDAPLVRIEEIVSARFPSAQVRVREASAGEEAEQDGGAALALPSPSDDIALAADGPADDGFVPNDASLDYKSIAGYQSVIDRMRSFGIGMRGDEEFERFVEQLNARHGLSQMPALDVLLFRSMAREDANRFIVATLNELKMPTIHMRMEESVQGYPVLCVSANSSDLAKGGSLQDVFAQGGVLVLEDLDLWSSPSSGLSEEGPAVFMMQLTRGAREAVNLITSAIDNPSVQVIVSASLTGAIDGFFLELLEPMEVIDIEYPTPEERVEIWMDIAHAHPSLRAVNKADLVRLSANMPRFDMYMAAREAIEEAYKQALSARRYCAVTSDNIFDKLAAYQPLESAEYSELEDRVVKEFSSDILEIEEILNAEHGSSAPADDEGCL